MKRETNALESKRKTLESSIVSHKFSQLSHNQNTHSSFSAQTCSASSWGKLPTFRNKQDLRHGSGSKWQFQSRRRSTRGRAHQSGQGSGSPTSPEKPWKPVNGSGPSSTATGTRRLQLIYTQMLALLLTKALLMIWIISINFLGNWLPSQQKDIFLMIQRNTTEELP